jgi:hypothetical protein
VDEHLASLEEKTGKRFGDPGDPLLVSVRSGAAVSMPGMMDTILNLGLNDEAVRGLSGATGNARFANDSYRRLIQMYGEVVEGIDGHLFEEALSKLKDERGAALDVDLSAEDLAGLVDTYKGIYESETGGAFPQDARDQLSRAVRAVFESWDNPRAQVYRRAHHIPDDLGTAVNVVQMVFGNKGEQSASRSRVIRPRASRGSTESSSPTRRVRTSLRASGHPSRSPRCRRLCRTRSSSSWTRCAGSRSTTGTCRTSSSRSRTGGCTSFRRAAPSGRPRRR